MNFELVIYSLQSTHKLLALLLEDPQKNKNKNKMAQDFGPEPALQKRAKDDSLEFVRNEP